jgi:hypothetical protein
MPPNERASAAIGFLLICGSIVFLWQVFGIVREVVTLPDPEIHLNQAGDPVADIPTVRSRDIGLSKVPFLLLHLWLPLAGRVYITTRKGRPHVWTPLRAIGVASIVVILAGHGGAIWLSSQGVRIGVL